MSIEKNRRYVVDYDFISAANRLVAHMDTEDLSGTPKTYRTDILDAVETVRTGIAALAEEAAKAN